MLSQALLMRHLQLQALLVLQQQLLAVAADFLTVFQAVLAKLPSVGVESQ